jgi:prevent-host-death family protein
MTRWQLQEAKNRLSEVVRKAHEEGPQMITLRGDDAVVVLTATEFHMLTRKHKENLVQFFASSPLKGVDLDLARSRDTGRKVGL